MLQQIIPGLYGRYAGGVSVGSVKAAERKKLWSPQGAYKVMQVVYPISSNVMKSDS